MLTRNGGDTIVPSLANSPSEPQPAKCRQVCSARLSTDPNPFLQASSCSLPSPIGGPAGPGLAEQMSERFGFDGRFSSRRTSLAAKVLEDNSGERDDGSVARLGGCGSIALRSRYGPAALGGEACLRRYSALKSPRSRYRLHNVVAENAETVKTSGVRHFQKRCRELATSE